jgi:hypothetical protein
MRSLSIRAVVLVASVSPPAPAVLAGEEPPARGGDAAAAAADAFLAEWGKRMEGTRSLRLLFRQEKKLRILRRPRVLEGDLAYEDGKLSVIIRGRNGEVESEVRFRDGRLTIHYPRLRRAEVIDLGGGAGPPGPGAGAGFLPIFAGDPREARKDHDVALVRRPGEPRADGGARALDVLVLTPRDPKSPVKRIEMAFEGFEMREYLQVDASGDEARMTITSAERNAAIPPGRFAAELPEGTVVVPLDAAAAPAK